MESSHLAVSAELIAHVTDYVKAYMAHYDSSHDFSHVQRVVCLAKRIHSETPGTSKGIVTLAALLHDVGDKKYIKPDQDPSRLVYTVLLSHAAAPALAETIQAICLGVSYSSEVKDPAHVTALIERYPELAVVQDADRLDALGAVGAGRAFTFGGARGRPMGETIDHFSDKLVKLEGMMKTEAGRRLAGVRTERIRLVQEWWRDETEGVEDVM